MDKSDLPVSVECFHQICRVCLLKSKSLFPIDDVHFAHRSRIDSEIEDASLHTVLKKYCNIKVSQDDRKPQNVCEGCINLLADAFNTFENFLESNNHLDKIIEEQTQTTAKEQQILNFINILHKLAPNIKNIHVKAKADDSCKTSKTQSKHKAELILTNSYPDEITLAQIIAQLQNDLELKGATFDDLHDVDIVFNSDNPSSNISSSVASENNVDEDFNPDISSDSESDDDESVVDSSCETIFAPTVTVEEGIEDAHQDSIQKGERRKHPKETSNKSTETWEDQEEQDIFTCRFCDIEPLQGLEKVIEHLQSTHTLTKDCILCPRKLFSHKLMVYHTASHAQKQKFVCAKCSLYLKDDASLKAHYESDEHKNFKMRCPVCQKSITKASALIKHYQGVHLKSSDTATICPVCGLKLKYKKNLDRHLIQHKADNEKRSFLCELCAAAFVTREKLTRHVMKVHEGKPVKNYSTPEQKKKYYRRIRGLPEIDVDKNKTYTCEYCSTTFRRKASYFTHRISHPECTNIECPFCDLVLPNPSEYTRHRREDHKNEECKECGKFFPNKLLLYHHRHDAHKSTRKRCSFCPKTFAKATSLRAHENVHMKVRPYACGYCDKKFSQPSHVRTHEACMHTNDRKYACKVCGKRFLYQGLLKAHERTHTGYKPFVCPYCRKDFRDTTTRHKHVKKAHPTKWEDYMEFREKVQDHENQLAERVSPDQSDFEDEMGKEEEMKEEVESDDDVQSVTESDSSS